MNHTLKSDAGNGVQLRSREDGSLVVTTKSPQECVQCHEMHAVFVSRNGRTRCWNCDDKLYGIRVEIPPQKLARIEGGFDVEWPADTTCNEAMSWALQKFGNNIVLFVAAYQHKSPGLLDFRCRDFRHIVTRLEAYSRMKQKQWSESRP